MMLPNEGIYLIGMDRHRERLRRAARNRYLCQNWNVHGKSNRFSYPLAWLGRRLVAWGRHLEDRYGAEPRPLHSDL
jgi:hypothetical protein